MATLRPPPASRTRAVLQLQQAVKLYEMQHHHHVKSLTSIKSFIEETLDARPTMFVRTITTDSIIDCDENDMKKIEVNFYASTSDGEDDVTSERVGTTTNFGIQKYLFFSSCQAHGPLECIWHALIRPSGNILCSLWKLLWLKEGITCRSMTLITILFYLKKYNESLLLRRPFAMSREEENTEANIKKSLGRELLILPILVL